MFVCQQSHVKLSNGNLSAADRILDFTMFEQRTCAVHLDLEGATGCNLHIVSKLMNVGGMKGGIRVRSRHIPLFTRIDC